MAQLLSTNIKFIQLGKSYFGRFKKIHINCLPFAKYSDETYEHFLTKPVFKTHAFVNEKNKILSFIVLVVNTDICDIVSIGTIKQYRRQGLAIKMLDQCVEMYSLKNAFLEVQTSNIPAINLYINYGFEIIGIRKESSWGMNSYLMRKVVNKKNNYSFF